MKRFKYSILAAAAAVPAAGILFASAAGPNLVTNSTFDTDNAGWTAMGSTPISWENSALKVANPYSGTGNSYYSALQCVDGLQGGTTYTVSVDAFVGLDQPEPNTRAVLYAYVFDGDNCTGSQVAGLEASGASTSAQRGMWITLSNDLALPANAKSMRLRPTSVKEPKPYSSSIPETMTVFFDNFYVGEADVAQPDPEPPVDNDPQPDPDPTPAEPQADPAPEEPADEPVEDPTPEPNDEPENGEPVTPETPEVPETPETPGAPEEPWEPQSPWEPPAPQVPDSPAQPEAPVEPQPQQPEPAQPEADEPATPEEPTSEVPATPVVEPSSDAPLPPATGESLAQKATSSWGALIMSFGLALSSMGAAALGATRRR